MNKKSIRFHIESNDYFGTLATRVDLLLQDVSRHGYKREYRKDLEELRNELLYLQDRYVISVGTQE